MSNNLETPTALNQQLESLFNGNSDVRSGQCQYGRCRLIKRSQGYSVVYYPSDTTYLEMVTWMLDSAGELHRCELGSADIRSTFASQSVQSPEKKKELDSAARTEQTRLYASIDPQLIVSSFQALSIEEFWKLGDEKRAATQAILAPETAAH